MNLFEKEIKNVFFNNPDILERVVKKIIDDKLIVKIGINSENKKI